MQALIVLAVALLALAPKQFVAVGQYVIGELTPIAHEGLVLVITGAAIAVIVKSRF